MVTLWKESALLLIDTYHLLRYDFTEFDDNTLQFSIRSRRKYSDKSVSFLAKHIATVQMKSRLRRKNSLNLSIAQFKSEKCIEDDTCCLRFQMSRAIQFYEYLQMLFTHTKRFVVFSFVCCISSDSPRRSLSKDHKTIKRRQWNCDRKFAAWIINFAENKSKNDRFAEYNYAKSLERCWRFNRHRKNWWNAHASICVSSLCRHDDIYRNSNRFEFRI